MNICIYAHFEQVGFCTEGTLEAINDERHVVHGIININP